MPGWDTIKNRALSSINNAAQKADRMTQIAGLRKQIQQMQQERQDAIVQLGTAVYESATVSEAWPPEWQPFSETIRHCDDQIAALTQNIEQLLQDNPESTQAACPQCHSSVSGAIKFCPQCGSSLA